MGEVLHSHAMARRVLVVEDVGALRALVRVSLEDERTSVLEAGDFDQARSVLLSVDGANLDVIVLDLELPDGFGLDLLPYVSSRTRVIALSAHDDRETALQCMKAGCAMVLNKRTGLDRLKGCVDATAAEMPARGSRIGTGIAAQYVTFLAESRVDVETALARADYTALRRVAHRLRGTAVHFGYPGIGNAARSVSTALGSGSDRARQEAASTLVERIGEAIEGHQRAAVMAQGSV